MDARLSHAVAAFLMGISGVPLGFFLEPWHPLGSWVWLWVALLVWAPAAYLVRREWLPLLGVRGRASLSTAHNLATELPSDEIVDAYGRSIARSELRSYFWPIYALLFLAFLAHIMIAGPTREVILKPTLVVNSLDESPISEGMYLLVENIGEVIMYEPFTSVSTEEQGIMDVYPNKVRDLVPGQHIRVSGPSFGSLKKSRGVWLKLSFDHGWWGGRQSLIYSFIIPLGNVEGRPIAPSTNRRVDGDAVQQDVVKSQEVLRRMLKRAMHKSKASE